MPELPEVETVKETLKKQVLNKKIKEVQVLYPNIIAEPSYQEFCKLLVGQTINDIKRRGKWLVFELDKYDLISHLRMEGKYFIRKNGEEILKHEHVIFTFTDNTQLRYHDTRKFGRVYLVAKDKLDECKPIKELGLEPWDSKLTKDYLYSCYQKKRLPIKTVILDQGIITGIGNIYADEVLFLSRINPLIPANKLTFDDCEHIIENTKVTLEKAIKMGGTTIRSYTSSEGVHGRFQNELYVHSKENEPCPNCGKSISKIKVGGRGTYYCENCQKTI